MERDIKGIPRRGGVGVLSPEEVRGREDWKVAPSRETTSDDPASENARIHRERRVDENAPLADAGARVAAGAQTPLTLISPSFEHGAPMPDVHAAAGGNLSPPLRWFGVPERARSLALLVEDPDAPDPRAPKGVFTHWIVVNIPPSSANLSAGASRGNLPGEARQGRNDKGTDDYTGPAPPIGRHRYFFRLFALDTVLSTTSALLDRAALLAAIKEHVLVETHALGTYETPRNPTS